MAARRGSIFIKNPLQSVEQEKTERPTRHESAAGVRFTKC
ncbi:hypothetical protein PGR6_07970 [Pseudomonas sp. GR 6-02]|nr:hypothetical protein PGR6_07970 [Pseudomonas sp. GR 6-02]